MSAFQETHPGDTTYPALDRRAHRVRMKYNPEITLGNILTLASILGGLTLAYGGYTRDQEKQDNRIVVLEKNQDSDKKEVKESITKVESSISKIADSLTTLDKNVAIINAKTGSSK